MPLSGHYLEILVCGSFSLSISSDSRVSSSLYDKLSVSRAVSEYSGVKSAAGQPDSDLGAGGGQRLL